MNYDELQNSLKNVEMFMHALLEIKPKEKEVDKLQEWNILIEPFRIETRRIQYELIETLKEKHK